MVLRRKGEWGEAMASGRYWAGILAGAALAALVSFGSASATPPGAAYTYDDLGRVSSVAYSNGSTTTTIYYYYDYAGNRTEVATTAEAPGSTWGVFKWGAGTWS